MRISRRGVASSRNQKFSKVGSLLHCLYKITIELTFEHFYRGSARVVLIAHRLDKYSQKSAPQSNILKKLLCSQIFSNISCIVYLDLTKCKIHNPSSSCKMRRNRLDFWQVHHLHLGKMHCKGLARLLRHVDRSFLISCAYVSCAHIYLQGGEDS